MIGLLVSSPFTFISNASAQPNTAPIIPRPPTLSTSSEKAIIAAALAVPELKSWSNEWKYVGMTFLGTNQPTVQWQYAIVNLKAPSNSAPFACDQDWSAWIKVDLVTNKVVFSDYPSSKAHICQGITGEKVNTHSSKSDPHGYSIAEQNDAGGTSEYGNYAEFPSPSHTSTIYSHLNGAYVGQFLNAVWNHGTGCSDAFCIEQAGWVITAVAGCTGCGISVNSSDIGYVDESRFNDEHVRNTGLTWVDNASIAGSTSCSSSTYGITITYAGQLFGDITNIPCTSAQLNDVHDNSVFLENTDTQASSNWSGDITGTVSATNAFEFDSSGGSNQWNTSNNQDADCKIPTGYTTSQVITSGSLRLGGTATWGALSKQQVAC